MKERFQIEHWLHGMRTALARKNVERLAFLMYENDPNGVFSYDDYCNEFGDDTTLKEWADSTIECAETMLSQVESEL